MTSVTNAESETESYAYNNAGYRTSVTNGRGKTRTYTYTDRGEVATLTLPDSSVEAWSYNGNGQTSAYTNPLSQVIYYTYDDAGRQTGIDYPSGTDVAFSYDHADRRTGMTDSTGSTGWVYNAASELTGFNSPQGNLTYTYTSAGQRATMVDGGLTTTYTYDDAGRLTNLENGYSEDTAFVYDNAGRLTQQTFDTGQKSIFGYDVRGRQISVDHKTSANAVLSEEDYVYDAAGNLTSKTVDSVTTTYTYDDIDQLLSESRSGYAASYTYDANGNRTSKTLNSVTENYTVDDADKLTEIKVGSTTVKSFGYDAAGRTTSVVTGAGTTTVAYDYEGRISQITYPSTATNTFAYNGLDTRVSKVDSAGTATYKRDGAHVTAPVIGDGSAVYTPGISERRSSTTKFYGADRLGTNSLETNTSQSVSATKTYDAFGMPVASTGSSASPFGFAGGHGYQEDADSGLKLLGHRYYDASTGRFLTRDPIKDGRNWYGYCENNPVVKIDPTGTIGFLAAAAAVYKAYEFVTTVIDIIKEPTDPWNYVGLIPVPGSKLIKKLRPVISKVDDAVDAGKNIDRLTDAPKKYEDVLPTTQGKYPKKAGKIEEHHENPKYMGGDPNGKTVAIDAEYHQHITNEFQKNYPYGQGPTTAEEMERIKKIVYDKWPLPE